MHIKRKNTGWLSQYFLDFEFEELLELTLNSSYHGCIQLTFSNFCVNKPQQNLRLPVLKLLNTCLQIIAASISSYTAG